MKGFRPAFEGESLKSYDIRRGVKLTTLEKAHYACRKAYIEDGNINNVKKPKGVKEREWKSNLAYYEIPSSTATFEVRFIDEVKGLGIYAKVDIPENTVIEGLLGKRGNCAKSGTTGTSIVTMVQTIDKPRPTMYTEDLHYDLEVSYYLRGLLSFLNHACESHCNCTPSVGGFDDYSRVKTLKKVLAGEELLICYANEDSKTKNDKKRKGPWSHLCSACTVSKRRK